jgi:hypothetical protein
MHDATKTESLEQRAGHVKAKRAMIGQEEIPARLKMKFRADLA